MTDRPILFSAPMVRALLAGTKTQTRRILKPQPGEDIGLALAERPLRWVNGDRLWVREVCRGEELDTGQDGVRYRADQAWQSIEDNVGASIKWLHLHTYRGHEGAPAGPWVPPIHMPRWASRITLIVTNVRVQRLRDISEEDATAEGIEEMDGLLDEAQLCARAKYMAMPATESRVWYAELWEELHGPGSWFANPWVVALTFTVDLRNIDKGSAT